MEKKMVFKFDEFSTNEGKIDCDGKCEYVVETEFVFKGKFIVKAENKQQAEEYVKKHCGLVIGGDIHSSLPDNEIDWDFNTHPEKNVISVKKK